MELDSIKCMDCIEYLKTLSDNSVDLVLTDPPYNVSQRQNLTFGGRPIVKNQDSCLTSPLMSKKHK